MVVHVSSISTSVASQAKIPTFHSHSLLDPNLPTSQNTASDAENPGMPSRQLKSNLKPQHNLHKGPTATLGLANASLGDPLNSIRHSRQI